jgi:hypothetical protein
MSELVVNNPNILFDTSEKSAGFRRGRHVGRVPPETEMAALRKLSEIRHEIDETVCSATWAEDCLYRGAEYCPDFKCACPVCSAEFPNRRHPRPVRESDYSLDCQVEAGEDPEFAEELARLRNDRPRAGSVFVGRSGGQRGRKTFRGGDGSFGGDA